MIVSENAVRRLLVLDDDEAVNFTICAIARSVDFDPRATTSPDEFLDIVRDWTPSHIVIDLAMPRVDGVEMLHRLAGQGCDGSIIIASGLGTRILEAAARAASENGLHVAGVLPKPFNAGKLRRLLDTPAPNGRSKNPGSGGAPATIDVTAPMLADGIARDQIVVHYQPKVSVATGEIVAFEGLARWNHPRLGLIPPDRFIPVAESTSSIFPLTYSVFDGALAWLAECFGSSNTGICLNLSPKVLSDPGFPSWMLQRSSDHGIDPERITLEITETSSMQDPVATLEFLTQFRIKGFSLSIDDFGVGYSSLVQLARLPFSELKIDKGFVVESARSEESRKISAAIVGLAHALGLRVTAEGVEDEWTFRYLDSIGCDYAQGYWIAKPLAGDAAFDWAVQRQSPRVVAP